MDHPRRVTLRSESPFPPHVEALASAIVDAAWEVYRILGPGLLERTYVLCLRDELESRGLVVRTEVEIQVAYKGRLIAEPVRADLLVEGLILIEAKAAEELKPAHEAQLLNYMRLGGFELGFLINFHSPYFKAGVKRLVRTRSPS